MALLFFSPDELKKKDFYTSKTFGEMIDAPKIGPSQPMPGEERMAASVNSHLRPEAKVRLFALYGMGGFALSLHEWWKSAPCWLSYAAVQTTWSLPWTAAW